MADGNVVKRSQMEDIKSRLSDSRLLQKNVFNYPPDLFINGIGINSAITGRDHGIVVT